MKRLPAPIRCIFLAAHPKRVDTRLFIVGANHKKMNEPLNQSFHRKLKVRFSRPAVFMPRIKLRQCLFPPTVRMGFENCQISPQIGLTLESIWPIKGLIWLKKSK